jgi:hypothetical protein
VSDRPPRSLVVLPTVCGGVSREEIDINIVSLDSQASQSTSFGAAVPQRTTYGQTSQLDSPGESEPTPTRRPPLSTHGALRLWHDGERSERLSQVLENRIGWRSVLCASQAALSRSAEGQSPLL